MFINRHPMYEKLRSLKGGIYIIEGIIGVGKTTLGISLEKYLNDIGLKCKFYKEYVNEDFLNQFIGDMKSYAYFFQMMMAVKRIEIYKQAEDFSKLGGISFIDRSLIGDITFATMHYNNGNISDDEWKIYNNFIKNEKLLTPSACIYLQCNSETCLNRIKNRGLKSEILGYDINYLNKLNNVYEIVILNNTNLKTIVLDWNKQLNLLDKIISEDYIIEILDLLL